MSEDKTPYAPSYEGTTYNGKPVLAHEGKDADMRVVCLREERAHDSLKSDPGEECEWEGPASELERGRPKIGSKPRDLLCPNCSWTVAAESDTTSAGHWDGKLS